MTTVAGLCTAWFLSLMVNCPGTCQIVTIPQPMYHGHCDKAGQKALKGEFDFKGNTSAKYTAYSCIEAGQWQCPKN